MLGVTTPTVSRMVNSLQALGFVRAERSPYDRRQRVVRLTEMGFERMQATIQCFIGGRIGRKILDRAFGRHGVRGKSRADTIFQRMCDYEYLLHCIRETCGDSARLVLYPWHPDD
jgi:DNA-binding PadR family transcriptional regulator